MAFSWSIDGDHETGNTRKRPEGARPIWLLALGLPLRRSSEPPFRDTLYLREASYRLFVLDAAFDGTSLDTNLLLPSCVSVHWINVAISLWSSVRQSWRLPIL